MSAAEEITRRAKSNLAFALRVLPKGRREDMVIFYGFCRTVDDIADEPAIPLEKRSALLDEWENGLIHGFSAPTLLQQEVLSLCERHKIPNELLVAIIDGCRMDLHPQRFATWEDLSGYIWKVACAVGLVSIRLFGCKDPASERYALALGHALQLTNILRDVKEDYENGRRIYLPMEDLSRFGYTEQNLANHVSGQEFRALMDFEAQRAKEFFHKAESLLPPMDRQALVPARMMGEIYHLLLQKMESDGFQVFQKRYKVSKIRKFAVFLKHLIAGLHFIE